MERDSTTTAGRARQHVLLGAVAGAVGVLVVMPFFYPFGRRFDPTVGGDTPTGLPTELILGFIGGVVLSPVAALIGGGVALALDGRHIRLTVAALLVLIGSTLAIGLLSLLNVGFVDEAGSLSSLQFVAALGALAGTVAVAFYKLGQRVVLSA